MMLEEWLPLLMFPVLLTFLLLGFPVAFTLGGTALMFGLIGHFLDLFYLTDFGFIPMRVFGIVGNFTLVAVPLFVFMGLVLEKTGIAEELLRTVNELFHRQRGSLAVAVVLVGALLAASTGIVGATVVTMGVLSLPTMLNRGYQKELSCGTIAAAGTLGQIIPPSIVLVLLGDMMNVDVGNLFVGALLPGLMLVGAYLVYLQIRLRFNPGLAPDGGGGVDPNGRLRQLALTLLPPIILMTLVLGSILLGLASPTEAAAFGAFFALIIALLKKSLSRRVLQNVCMDTAKITSMVFVILIGAQFFGVVFRGLAGDDVIGSLIADLEEHRSFILLGLMVLLFVLGFFLDFLEICFIVIPIILPHMVQLGYDPLWLAVLIAVNLQTSFLTPPFGFALFYLKGVSPPGVSTMTIYRGVIPFVIIQLASLGVLAMYPQLVQWLPGVVFGR